MSGFLQICGPTKLNGEICISGAKNAALPILISTLLTKSSCIVRNVPDLEDLAFTIKLLEQIGSEVKWNRSDRTITVSTDTVISTEASYPLVKALRASFWVLGPLLARERRAKVALPGGDAIGTRPVDQHLLGLERMGAQLSLEHGTVIGEAKKGLKAAEILLSCPSVGATHQLMMAMAATPGRSVIRNAAREPEVVALAEFLSSMGATLNGAGSSDIEIWGSEDLGQASTDLIGDRIEAGSYLLAALACRGQIKVKGVCPEHLGALLELLRTMGAEVSCEQDSIYLEAKRDLKAAQVVTAPHPGFPTDLQAPLMAALATVEGESSIDEQIFEGRFGHSSELMRMGARIEVSGSVARIVGGAPLSGAPVECGDIRAGFGLIVAALCAQGSSSIFEVQHLRRGYQDLEYNLSALGAKILYRHEEIEDFLATGC